MTDIDESRIPTPDPSEGQGHFDPDDYDVYRDSRVLPDAPKTERDEESERVWGEDG